MAGNVTVRGGGLSVKILAESAEEAIERYPEAFSIEARKAFRTGGIDWERSMKKRFLGFSAVGPTRGLRNRSGNLRRTLQYRVLPAGGGATPLSRLKLVMQVGDNRAPYALAQEYGAVITPKKARALTVPMPDSLTPSGVIKGSAILRRTGDGYETDYGPTFIYKPSGAGGGAYIAVRNPDGGLRLLYVLKKRVVIPGPKTTGIPSRLGGVSTAESMISDKLMDELAEAARRVWVRAN